MKAEYLRDLNRKYLVMTDCSDGFETRMLLRNKTNGFIMLKKEEWDNETRLYYDITGKQSLEKGFIKRKITYEDLAHLLYSISSQVKECRRLFLDVSGLVLSPEYIYKDVNSEKYYWIFNPGENDSTEILELAEYLLEHIDNQNQSVVKTTYELYRRAKEGSIDAENLYELLQGDETKQSEDENVLVKEAFNPVEKANNKEFKRNKTKLEQTIDKLFYLMKKKNNEREKTEEPLFNREDIYKGTEEDDERIVAGETVLLSLPEAETRILISRDQNIGDAKLKDFPCVLGSKADSVDIVLNDKSVSRVHAQIDEAEGRLYIYDMNSTNGTYINGVKIVSEEKEIKEGDEIRLGNLRFVLA